MSNQTVETVETTKKSFKLPHILVLLFSLVLICAIATWLVPAGEFDRMTLEDGKETVVPGTYHRIEASPVGPFEFFVSIFNGMTSAAPISFFIFIAYASIGLIVQTGAFNGLISAFLKGFKGKSKIIFIPFFITLIGIGSSTIGLFEETLPFIVLFVGAAIAMGYDAIVGMAIVMLGAAIGYSGAVVNPFTVGMAQSIAELEVMSGAGYRIICHIALITVASIYTMMYAIKIEKDPTKSLVYGDDFSAVSSDKKALESAVLGIRESLVLITLAVAVGVIVMGCKVRHWYLPEIAAVFLIAGLTSAAIMGYKPNDIATRIAGLCVEVAVVAIMIGLSRSVLVVLKEGHIIDTVVNAMASPLSNFPPMVAGEAMLLIQTFLNFLIPSGSGQAMTSMPIMVPLADILGISRQVSVLAFQFGDGLSNILWPTAFTPIMCGISKVKMEKWYKWFIPLFGLLILTQGVLIAIAIIIGYK